MSKINVSISYSVIDVQKFQDVLSSFEEGRVLTCVYCGAEYPQGTPTWGSDVLTEHIKICEKHPMRKAESTIVKLKAALIGLVGASEKDELEKMEMLIRVALVPDTDKGGMLNAIRALVELA